MLYECEYVTSLETQKKTTATPTDTYLYNHKSQVAIWRQHVSVLPESHKMACGPCQVMSNHPSLTIITCHFMIIQVHPYVGKNEKYNETVSSFHELGRFHLRGESKGKHAQRTSSRFKLRINKFCIIFRPTYM